MMSFRHQTMTDRPSFGFCQGRASAVTRPDPWSAQVRVICVALDSFQGTGYWDSVFGPAADPESSRAGAATRFGRFFFFRQGPTYKQNTHAHTFSPAALLLLVLLLLLIWFHTDYGKQQKAASEEGEKENREAGGVGSTL